MNGNATWRRVFATAVFLVLVLAIGAAPASARGGQWGVACGSYSSWTDTYSGDVVHQRACLTWDGNGNYKSISESYVTNYNLNKPINPYHAHTALKNKSGRWWSPGTASGAPSRSVVATRASATAA